MADRDGGGQPFVWIGASVVVTLFALVLAALTKINMALYRIPPNTGKVRVAVFHGGKYAVWNGKSGKGEFRILVRSKQQAEEIARMINEKKHSGSVEVLS